MHTEMVLWSQFYKVELWFIIQMFFFFVFAALKFEITKLFPALQISFQLKGVIDRSNKPVDVDWFAQQWACIINLTCLFNINYVIHSNENDTNLTEYVC